MPTTPKTTGDFIRLGRYEKGLKLSEIAAKLGVAASVVKAWEEDVQAPTESEWKAIAGLLGISNIAGVPSSPTRE